MSENTSKSMMVTFNNFSPNSLCGSRETTVFEISEFSAKIASSLCLNNYEISIWQYNFLRLWSLNPIGTSCKMKAFLSYLNTPHIEIFKYFSQIYSTINYDNIILFIWIFVFMEIDNLTLLLLSVHGYQSNISITYDQAIQFFISLNPNIMNDNFIKDWFNDHKQDELIMISDIIKVMKQSHALTVVLKLLKEELIFQFIGINAYQRILRRIQYYNLMSDTQQYREPPREGVLSKLKRIIVTKKPPPYYTEYRDYKTDYNLLKAELLYEIRVQFGYSRRLCLFDKLPTLRSRNSSYNKRHNISSIEVILTPSGTN